MWKMDKHLQRNVKKMSYQPYDRFSDMNSCESAGAFSL